MWGRKTIISHKLNFVMAIWCYQLASKQVFVKFDGIFIRNNASILSTVYSCIEFFIIHYNFLRDFMAKQRNPSAPFFTN